MATGLVMNNYIGLVHFPVRNKRGVEVATSVTNLDIHDIARTAKTYGFKKYFIITPLLPQQELVSRILGHWQGDVANEYNPDRFDALSLAKVENSIEDSVASITALEGIAPLLVVTGANFKQYDGNTDDLQSKIRLDRRPMFLLFGTGWGLSASVVERADFRLVPLWGPKNENDESYNHLSVRSAVAIYADRLFGRV
jgi:hypothetical protein